jgi:hypothetical protein
MTRQEHLSLSLVYEGMRTWLMETGLRLQATDFRNDSEAARVGKKVRDLLRAEAAMTETEEAVLFPVLLDKAPYLVCHFIQEHAEIARLRREVELAENAIHHYPSPEQVAGLRLAYTSYMAFVLQHGMREESILVGAGLADMQEGGAELGEKMMSRLAGWLEPVFEQASPFSLLSLDRRTSTRHHLTVAA